MSRQAARGFGSAFVGAIFGAVAATVGLPVLMVAVSVRLLGHPSPLHGVKTPWHWTVDDVHSWGRKLTEGLDSSGDLIDLFLRVGLVIGWICVAVLIYTIVDEVLFQLRHGMPSYRQRRLGGIGPIGRRLASALVAVLPMSMNATPALTGAPALRPAAAAVPHDLPAAVGVTPMTPQVRLPRPISTVPNGWSVIEVQRGDSVWAIAERVAGGRDIAVVAEAIVRANLGTEMVDGRRFSTPALIEPGWLLNVPSDVAGELMPSLLPTATDYIVEAGDSYWRIAEDHLAPDATGRQIAEYTEQLMEVNAPILGYSERRMIHPGDIVHLAESVPVAVDQVPVGADQSPQVPAAEQAPPVEPVEPAAAVPSVPSPPPPPTTVAVTPSPTTLHPPTTPPVPVPGPSTTSTAADESLVIVADDLTGDGLPLGAGFAGATVLAGSVVAALAARRRTQLRSAQVGARLIAPPERAVETERRLRSSSVSDRWARIDLALRAAAPHLSAQQARVLALELAGDGNLGLHTDRPATLGSPWVLDIDAGGWSLPAEVALAELAGDARRADQPCPAIIHLGDTDRGQLFVDVEAFGLIGIDAPAEIAASIVRGAAATLALSPLAEPSRVFTVGLEPESQLGSVLVEALPSLDDAIEAIHNTIGSTVDASSSISTFGLRAMATGGEAWEPSLLLCVGVDDVDGLRLLPPVAAGGGRGVGIMVDRAVPGCNATLRADETGFVFEPLGLRVRPVGLTVAEVVDMEQLLDSADRSVITEPHEPAAHSNAGGASFVGRAHQFVVRLLGQVEVRSAEGVAVGFERSKAQELVVWLTQHRHRPTRGSARTALWETLVRDATFSNVVSDARRAMAKVVPPPAGHEWIGRTLSEELPLHELVVSDVELLADRVAAARELTTNEAIDVLRPGVALIEGMPFAGTSYLWPDAEGITSALVLLSTSAAATLASHYLEIGDVDGVFWATGQGLKVLAGHEELIALRMRAHADRGDLAGVRGEWESYERALQADSWAAEPSPKLIELRRELLSPSMVS